MIRSATLNEYGPRIQYIATHYIGTPQSSICPSLFSFSCVNRVAQAFIFPSAALFFFLGCREIDISLVCRASVLVGGASWVLVAFFFPAARELGVFDGGGNSDRSLSGKDPGILRHLSATAPMIWLMCYLGRQ